MNELDIEVVASVTISPVDATCTKLKAPITLYRESTEIAIIVKALIIAEAYAFEEERNFSFTSDTFDIKVNDNLVTFTINGEECFIPKIESVISPFVDMSTFPALELSEAVHEYELDGVTWKLVPNASAMGDMYGGDEGREFWWINDDGDMFPLEMDDAENIDVSATTYAFLANTIPEEVKDRLLEEAEENISSI